MVSFIIITFSALTFALVFALVAFTDAASKYIEEGTWPRSR